jgi:hypothetical protein
MRRGEKQLERGCDISLVLLREREREREEVRGRYGEIEKRRNTETSK